VPEEDKNNRAEIQATERSPLQKNNVGEGADSTIWRDKRLPPVGMAPLRNL
jgi:hypothetical protein